MQLKKFKQSLHFHALAPQTSSPQLCQQFQSRNPTTRTSGLLQAVGKPVETNSIKWCYTLVERVQHDPKKQILRMKAISATPELRAFWGGSPYNHHHLRVTSRRELVGTTYQYRMHLSLTIILAMICADM